MNELELKEKRIYLNIDHNYLVMYEGKSAYMAGTYEYKFRYLKNHNKEIIGYCDNTAGVRNSNFVRTKLMKVLYE